MRYRNPIDVGRRDWMHYAASAAAMGTMGFATKAQAKIDGVANGRIQQSIVHWCFADYWSVEETCQIAKRLGCKSVEIVDAHDWHILKKNGLTCALAKGPMFVQGMNNPRYQDACITHLKKVIDDCADAGFPAVIAFTGYAAETGDWVGGGLPDLSKWQQPGNKVIPPDEGIRNCVSWFKRVVGYAEQKKVNLSLEMLNTRDDSHPMKGHPGYQGNHLNYCMEIINQVGSPRLGLLFDIYHVQIMAGDIIRRIHTCGDVINHVHLAGNPIYPLYGSIA